MIASIGHLSLLLALIAAFIQMSLPLLGFYRSQAYLLASAKPALYLQSLAIAMAYLALTLGFLGNDFSISYIANNSEATLPWSYKMACVWAGYEGSLLLWVFTLNAWALVYAAFQKTSLERQLSLALFGMISFLFIAFIYFKADPFYLAPVQIPGQDLNPLLQDPGFFIHPPLLTFGYVGFVTTYVITFAALLNGSLNVAYLKTIRPYVITAWCVLTLGILLGCFWAYHVLGWGGFWFWDPVENLSLLPWLTGLALIHMLAIAQKKSHILGVVAGLALLAFCLSLLGTFLTRSGVLLSVHSFASDSMQGLLLLLLVGSLFLAALAVLVFKLPPLPPLQFRMASQETFLLLNAGLSTIAMLAILIGTLYPVFCNTFHLPLRLAGADFFITVLWPLTALSLGGMSIAAFFKRQPSLHKNQILPGLKNLIIGLLLAAFIEYLSASFHWSYFILLALNSFVLLQTVSAITQKPAICMAHLGFVILLFGILLSSLFTQTKTVALKPGDGTHIGPYQLFFLEVKETKTDHVHTIQGVFDVLRNGISIATLTPEKQIYLTRKTILTHPAIDPGIFRDLYLVLGDPLDNNFWSVRMTIKPFIRFIALGGTLMLFGGILSLRQKKRITHAQD